jgi:hypothetical protein
LQYGKVISYWHCRLAAATASCGCELQLLDHHSEKDHPTPVMIAKEKTQEAFLAHEAVSYKPALQITTIINRSINPSLIPADHTTTIFQPPRV